ncbi:MAG: hypothetical protein KC933_01510 [Myxococcales bacterium]|nr:hypothetical protein [Myxococcales bacterium]MCB9651870.1 hypothetical protein [Deltaproteobacteria bacterium]
MKHAWMGALAVLVAGSAAATPQQFTVTGGSLEAGLHDWRVVDVRTGGVSQVSTTRPDPYGGSGSLEQSIPAPGSDEWKTEVEIFSPDTSLTPGAGLVPTAGGYGRLADLRDLLVTWYRDGSSTAWPWLGEAVRIYVYDPDLGTQGSSYVLIWEPVYNGLPVVPTDQWIVSRVDDGNFWRTPIYLDGQRVPRSFCSDNPTECHRYLPFSAWGFGPDTVIFGLNLAVGSGWYGSYLGYVDQVNLEMPDGQTWIWDFEPGDAPMCSEAAPEPEHEHRRGRRRGRHH